MSRTLAIDLGSRRVGLALSDEGGKFATPYDVLFVGDPEQAIDPILRVIEKEGVRRLVVGLPLNMDGTTGPAARKTTKWGARLANRSGLPVIFESARISARLLLQDLGIDIPWNGQSTPAVAIAGVA